MKISCVCPTHGRAHIIGEAVESFLRQTYQGDKELLILNDCPEQPLECDAPGVRIINLPEPIPDAATKFNRAVAEADGELIAWWEDDDISLPHRLECSERLWKSAPDDLLYIKPAKAFMWHAGKITGHPANLFFGSSIFCREFYQECGGATPGEWADLSAHNNMAHGCQLTCLGPELTWFIYRWGGPVHHDSGTGEQDAAKRFLQFRGRTLAHKKFRPGLQRITPGWRMDYAAMAAQWVADHGGQT